MIKSFDELMAEEDARALADVEAARAADACVARVLAKGAAEMARLEANGAIDDAPSDDDDDDSED